MRYLMPLILAVVPCTPLGGTHCYPQAEYAQTLVAVPVNHLQATYYSGVEIIAPPLTDEEIERIAQRVVEKLLERLGE